MGVVLVCDFTNQFSNIRKQWSVEIQDRNVEEPPEIPPADITGNSHGFI